MAYVFDGNINNNTLTNLDIALGVRFTNRKGIFQSLYTIRTQAKENLKTLLLTRVGERYMQPTYGTNLINVLFEPNNEELKEDIQDLLKTAINYWLPYINIENFTIETAEENPFLPYQVQISLTYSIQGFSTDTITIFANNDNTLTVA